MDNQKYNTQAMKTKKRYKVNLYYGNERPDKTCWVSQLADARQLAMHSEHCEIIDTLTKEVIE